LLKQFPFGTEDLKLIRIVGGTGGPDATLDARITDFRVRAPSLPRTDSEAAHPVRWKTWLTGAILGLGLLIFLGLWLFRRRGTRADQKPASGLAQDEPDRAGD